jgi:hypothetical protein
VSHHIFPLWLWPVWKVKYFRKIFAPLVSREAEEDKRTKEELKCPIGRVKWALGLNKKVHATFAVPKFRDGSKLCSLTP